MTHALGERTYVNADGTKVVPEGSPEAAFLLGLEGDEIDDERAKALGLAKSSKKAAAEDADTEEAPPSSKAKPKNAGGLAKP